MKKILILLSLTAFTSQAQKKLLKQASTLELNKQYELASEKYKEVLYKNATRIEAISGLQRTAQLVVDEKLSAFFIARNSGELEQAIRLFESVLQFEKELKYFNVSIQIPSYYHNDYEADKLRLKEQTALQQESKEQAFSENNYTEAVGFYNQSKWVEAWDLFNQIKGYKNTNDYLDLIRSKGRRIAIIENSKNKFSKEDALRNSLLSELLTLNNPLIRIINRDNLDQLIEEQKLGLTGLLDEQSVADLGKILGVELMLLTRVLNYNFNEGSTSTQNKTAYIAAGKKVYDPVTNTTNTIKEYYPATYQIHSTINRLEVSLQYQLIEVATAEVLSSEVVFDSYENNIHYATYEGDPNTLYPSNGSVIYAKGKEREDFLQLFIQNSRALSQQEMDSKIQQVLSKKVAESLDTYFRK